MNKFLVVCRNHAQGKQWLRNKVEFDPAFCEKYPNRSSIIIATSPEQIRGMTVTTGIFLSGWEEGTKDPLGFLQLIYYATGGKNQKIRQMLEDYDQNPDRTYSIQRAAKALSDEIDKEVLRQLGVKP